MEEKHFQIEITDDDIDWIRSLMPDIEFDECRVNILKNMEAIDVHACPGSGKTTLLVAKLAILSKKWKYANRGICVLSHTNVAREEIQERLGKTTFGKKLLSYPHFIGTFQSFFDTFIAMPYLRSLGYPVNIIDTDYVTEQRWKSVSNNKYLIKSGKDKRVCDPIGIPFEFNVNCGKTSSTYKSLIGETIKSHQRGEFTFNEMEIYAKYAIGKVPEITRIVGERFPLLFIDEAQDTKAEVWDLIHQLYGNSNAESFYQAFGDGNQAIYNSYEFKEEVKNFPREEKLEMLNSKRLLPAIADLANTVALDKCKMTGECLSFENTNIKNTIFLFNEGCEKLVIDRFAELIFKSFTNGELEKFKKYGCHVLGMVHKIGPSQGEEEMAVRLSNYYPEYNPEIKKTVPMYLIDYFRMADTKMSETGELATKIEDISKGLYKLIKTHGLQKVHGSSNSFKTIMKMIKEENRISFRRQLLDIVQGTWASEKEWGNTVSRLLELFSDYIDVNAARMDSFLQWQGIGQEKVNIEKKRMMNKKLYYDSSGNELEISFGSIHSAKGRTHLATLVVETKYHEYNMSSILTWLSGKTKKLGERNKKRLKCQYVAMTRAKGLVCLAIPAIMVDKDERVALEGIGWHFESVNKG